MNHTPLFMAIGWIGMTGWLGCVSVDTPNTKVNVGITSVNLPDSSSSKEDTAPFARQLRKVSEHQSKVAKYLTRREWDDLVKKTSDWTDEIRDLRGYAHTSHDPRLFRECCDALMVEVQALRQAAMRQDGVRAQQAFDACDPPLNRLVRSFPPDGSAGRPGESGTRNSGNKPRSLPPQQKPQVP